MQLIHTLRAKYDDIHGSLNGVAMQRRAFYTKWNDSFFMYCLVVNQGGAMMHLSDVFTMDH